ncbi:P-loop NTPase [Microbacterium horticulturae]|uniref:Iron-sulfur cluster carrier protein n=1 Tax=Microbacterium horticulturae TaxID=3028316 RepID=A0ABY8BTL7_9MICO|nr:P-loop NTPase [Microbacterium sp. KACC 23027]WEG07511.1 P-loop NTPase [Microbacterium sp. KACC 23027]
MIADEVRAAVGAVVDPELRRPIDDMDMVREITVDDAGTAHVSIVLTVVGCPMAQKIERDVGTAAASVAGVNAVEVTVGTMDPVERAALVERLRGARGQRGERFGKRSRTRVIAVTSGKGGVGKSTLTANLAVALAARGRKVGLADLDVHGFSIPGLMGLVDATGAMPNPTKIDDMILPPVAHDVKTISIGMFLRGGSEGQAVAWRGPLLHRTVQQFLNDVHFDDIDVLLLDMPPGTGDIAITVGQLLPQADVVVVTTPQPAAADVAVRSGLVARQTGQHVLGVIENMAAMPLPDGTVLDLFGSGGGQAVADALSTDDEHVPVLGSIPLSPVLRQDGDAGTPAVLADPEDAASRALASLAQRIDELAPRRRGAQNIGHTGEPAGATTRA